MTNLPKKPKRPKSKKLNISSRSQWRALIKDIDKDDIPVDFLLSITVNLIDGSKININIKELLDQGTDPEVLHTSLDHKLQALDDYIKDIDFYVSIDDIVRTVQPITDQILKDL